MALSQGSTASRASRCSQGKPWSASSPTATCASRPASTCRCSEIMTPRERLVTVREGATLAEGKALMHKHKLERVLVVNDAFELRGPDHGQGHHQADQLSRTPRATRTASCASAPRSASARAPRSASSCWCKAGVDAIVVDTAHGHSAGVIERVRWVKRNYPQVDVIGGNIATGAGRAGAGRGRRRCGQGRHRPGLDLHHAHRRRRRRAADHGDRQRRQGAAGSGVPLIADGGIRYLGRHRQGHRRRRRHGDDGRHVRRHRRGAGRDHPVPGPQLQELPRHGLDRRDAAGHRRPLLPGRRGQRTGNVGSAKLVPEGIEGQVPYKGSVVGIVFQMAGGLRATMGYCGCASIDEMQTRPSSSRSPRRACARATCTTCRSPRKRRTTAPNDERRSGPADAPAKRPSAQAAMPFIMITVLIDMVSIGLIMPVLPPLVGSFTGSPAEQAFWYGAVDASPSASPTSSASPILGALSDRYGRRPVLLLGFCGLALSFFVTGAGDRAVDADRRCGCSAARCRRTRAVANAYVADITPPEDRAQALRPARRDVRHRLHPRAGDGRPARRDRPAPAVLRRRRAGAAQPAVRLLRAAGIAAGRASAGRSTGARANPVDVAARRSAQLRRRRPAGRGDRLHRAWRSSSLYTSWVLYTTFKFGWGPLENGWSLFAVGVDVGAGAGRAARPPAQALHAAAAGDRRAWSRRRSPTSAGALASEGWMMYAVIFVQPPRLHRRGVDPEHHFGRRRRDDAGPDDGRGELAEQPDGGASRR